MQGPKPLEPPVQWQGNSLSFAAFGPCKARAHEKNLPLSPSPQNTRWHSPTYSDFRYIAGLYRQNQCSVSWCTRTAVALPERGARKGYLDKSQRNPGPASLFAPNPHEAQKPDPYCHEYSPPADSSRTPPQPPRALANRSLKRQPARRRAWPRGQFYFI